MILRLAKSALVLAAVGALLLTLLVSTTPTLAQDQPPEPPERIPDVEVAWDGTYRRIRVPILMYHYVSELPEDADSYRTDLTVSPSVFREHMEYLFYQGYTPISLYQLNEALMNGMQLPAKPVVLTFDDAYTDHYTHVFPVLREFGFSGTFFVITGWVDEGNPAHMTWEQISEMANAGMSMESHSKTHADLRNRSYDFLIYEMLGSMQSLEAYTGRTSHMFSYPIGYYDSMTISVLRTLPVWRAVTTQGGSQHTTDNHYELPRLRVSGDTGVPGLAYLLENG